MRIKLIVLFGTLFALLLTPITARAADCDTTVVDGAGVYGSGLPQVRAAASALAAKGATVRVRTVTNYDGYSNLDQYEASLVDSCASWRGQTGRAIKNNLIVFMISTGAKTSVGLWYGSTWAGSLGSKWPTIQTEHVNPFLSTKDPQGGTKPRDFVGGTVNGLNAVTASLVAQPATPTPQPNPVPYQPAPVQPAPPPVVVQSQPTDLRGLWVVMGLGLGLLAIGAGVFFFLVMRKKRSAARAAQQKAVVDQNACASKVNDLEEDVKLLDVEVNGAAQLSSEEDVAELRKEAAAIARSFNAATARNADLAGAATDPTKDGLSVEEYEQIASGYNDILMRLNDVREKRTEFLRKIEAFKKRVEQAPSKLEETVSALAGASAEIEGVEKQGFRTRDSKAAMVAAEDLLAQARDALEKKRYGKVIGLASQAKDKAKAASDAVKGVVYRKVDIDASVARLKRCIEDSAVSLPSAKETLQSFAGKYARRSWADLAMKASDADRKIADARKLLADAIDASSMEKQNWDGCVDMVAKGQSALHVANGNMGDIRLRERDLEKSKLDVSTDLDQGDREVAAARSYVTENQADLDILFENDISTASRNMQGVRADLQREQPDYPEAIATTATARTLVAQALASAKKRVEAAEAERQFAIGEINEAAAEAEEASLYVAANERDVGVMSSRLIGDARVLIEQAKAAKMVVDRITLAQKASGKIKSAMDIAKNEVAIGDAERLKKQRELEAIQAETARVQAARDAEAQRQADAAAALVTGVAAGVVLGTALSHGDRSSRQDRDDADDQTRYGGGGSTDVEDAPTVPDDSGTYGGGGSTDVDDSPSESDDSGSGDSGGGGSSDVD